MRHLSRIDLSLCSIAALLSCLYLSTCGCFASDLPNALPITKLLVRKAQSGDYYIRLFGSNQAEETDFGEVQADCFKSDSAEGNRLLADVDAQDFKATVSLVEPAPTASQAKTTIFLQRKSDQSCTFFERDLPLYSNLQEIVTEPFPESKAEKKPPSWLRRWLNNRILKEAKKSSQTETLANELEQSALYQNALATATARRYHALRYNITEFRIDLAQRTLRLFFDHKSQWAPDEVISQTFANEQNTDFAIILVAKKDSRIQSAIFLDELNIGKPGEKSDKPKFSAYLFYNLKQCKGTCLNASIFCFGNAVAALPVGHVPGATAAYLHCIVNDKNCRTCAMQAMIQSIIDYATGANLVQ